MCVCVCWLRCSIFDTDENSQIFGYSRLHLIFMDKQLHIYAARERRRKRESGSKCLHVFIKFSIRKSLWHTPPYVLGFSSKWKLSSENERRKTALKPAQAHFIYSSTIEINSTKTVNGRSAYNVAKQQRHQQWRQRRWLPEIERSRVQYEYYFIFKYNTTYKCIKKMPCYELCL